MNQISSKTKTISPIQKIVNTFWPYISGKRGKILLVLVVVSIGLVINWGWLVAVGIAPILITFLPCAVMCALGMCMHGNKKSCSSKSELKEQNIEEK